MAHRFLAFPDTVNEYAARVTAGLIVLLTLATLLTEGLIHLVLLSLLAVGFALRVAGGPRYSPLGRLSVHVLVPLLRRPPAPRSDSRRPSAWPAARPRCCSPSRAGTRPRRWCW